MVISGVNITTTSVIDNIYFFVKNIININCLLFL